MSHSTDRPHWAEPENQRNHKSRAETPTTVIEDLKRDVDNLKRDIAELRLENGKNGISITRLSDIVSVLQDRYNEMLRGYDKAKLRIVELERATNKKMSKKANSASKRERSRSRSPPRVPRIVVKQNRGNNQVRSHPCFNHPNCIIVDGVHDGSLESLH